MFLSQNHILLIIKTIVMKPGLGQLWVVHFYQILFQKMFIGFIWILRGLMILKKMKNRGIMVQLGKVCVAFFIF